MMKSGGCQVSISSTACVIGGKGFAALVSVVSLALLPLLFDSHLLSEFLKLQAIAITAASLSNLGAVPFVAESFLGNKGAATGELFKWLGRRFLALLIVSPAVVFFVFEGQGLAEYVAYAFVVTIWGVGYSYDLTDVALITSGRPMSAVYISIFTALSGLLLRLGVAYMWPSLVFLVAVVALEVLSKFLIQLFFLNRFTMFGNTAQEKDGRLTDDFPIFISSMVNAASNRADQMFAGMMLGGSQATIYFMASRLIDAIWFVPTTVINMSLSKGVGIKRGLVGGLFFVNLLVVMVLLGFGYVYEHFRSDYLGMTGVLLTLSSVLFYMSFNTLNWRIEASQKDKITGLLRSLVQLILLLLVYAYLYFRDEGAAIYLALACVLAKLGSVVISVAFIPKARNNFIGIFSK